MQVSEQTSAASSGQLPFTGFVAITLVIVGVGLAGTGLVIRFVARAPSSASVGQSVHRLDHLILFALSRQGRSGRPRSRRLSSWEADPGRVIQRRRRAVHALSAGLSAKRSGSRHRWSGAGTRGDVAAIAAEAANRSRRHLLAVPSIGSTAELDLIGQAGQPGHRQGCTRLVDAEVEADIDDVVGVGMPSVPIPRRGRQRVRAQQPGSRSELCVGGGQDTSLPDADPAPPGQ